MKPAQIYRDIQARLRWPYKADTPEHDLDIPRIYEVARESRADEYLREAIVLIVSVFALFNLYKTPAAADYYAAPELNWITIWLTLTTLTATQFYFRRAMRKRARAALREVVEERTETDATKESISTSCNLIISGGYTPFVGCGAVRRSWSFTVDLQKPGNESEPIEKLVAEALYAETAQDIERLSLRKLKISDVVCLDGRDLSAIGLEPQVHGYRKPPDCLAEGELAKLIGTNHPDVRHYKVLHANLWGGQVVLSVFFRYVIQSELLFVESRILALPPLKREYLELERMPDRADFKEICKDAVESLLFAPLASIPVMVKIAAFVSGGFLDRIKDPATANAEAIDRDRKFNYGWPVSLREQWAARDYERFFQEVDIDFYEKSITEALLESLQGSLKKRNISVDGFRQASTTIFNAGIMMSGGKITAESVAAGAGATAFSKVLQRVSSPQRSNASAQA